MDTTMASMIFAVHTFWPDTAGGWVALIVGVTVVLGFIGGVVGGIIAINKTFIGREISVSQQREVKRAVDEGICPLKESIDVLIEHRSADHGVLNRAVQRIVGLEATINNGLTHKTDETAKIVASMQVQLAEMHGWMKATNAVSWDGRSERRT